MQEYNAISGKFYPDYNSLIFLKCFIINWIINIRYRHLIWFSSSALPINHFSWFIPVFFYSVIYIICTTELHKSFCNRIFYDLFHWVIGIITEFCVYMVISPHSIHPPVCFLFSLVDMGIAPISLHKTVRALLTHTAFHFTFHTLPVKQAYLDTWF